MHRVALATRVTKPATGMMTVATAKALAITSRTMATAAKAAAMTGFATEP